MICLLYQFSSSRVLRQENTVQKHNYWLVSVTCRGTVQSFNTSYL